MQAACRLYVADAAYGDDLLSACQELNEQCVTIRLPPAVLGAHWDDDRGFSVLWSLSTRYRIVPPDLLSFLQHCVRRGWCVYDFLHPCSLFAAGGPASVVYAWLGRRPITLKLLETLRYLSSSQSSNQHVHHLADLLHAGLDSVRGASESLLLCSLAYRHMSAEQIARLNLASVSALLTDSSMHTGALHLVARLSLLQRSRVAGALAWAARCGRARAVHYLQDLSQHAEHAAAVAAACQHYPWSAYIDRLGMHTLWHMVPYLQRYRANAGLVRMCAHDGPRAMRMGVLTTLLANGRPVPSAVQAVVHPATTHQVVHYVHALQMLPPSPAVIDVAMADSEALQALKRISRRCAPLRRYMVRAAKWARRRFALTALVQGHTALDASLQAHEFAWRLVFAYL